MTIGLFLVVEVFVGAYMWLSLGPLQDPFRGKNTFATPEMGLTASDSLADPGTVLKMATSAMAVDPAAIQMIEWRHIAEHPVWVVRKERNEVGTVFSVGGSIPWDPVPAEVVSKARERAERGKRLGDLGEG